ncbi:MAG: hypothetical protein ABIR68_14755 [Ilumatobacteraceae bacterium]
MNELGPDSDAAGWELASAYIDDDLDALASAKVESSPELLAMVVEVRQLRDSLATPPVVPPLARESAIAAALAAFDAGHSTSNPSPDVAPDVPPAYDAAATSGSATEVRAVVHDLEARRARRRFTWITGAAAAVMVVVIGVVALRSGNGSDTNLSSSKQATATTSFSETAGVGGAADSQASATSPAAAPAPNQAAAATTAAGRTQAATATNTATAAPDGAGSGGAGAPQVAATTSGVALTSPDQLLDLPRAEVATAPAADTVGPGGGSASTAAAAATTAAPSPPCVQSPAVLLGVIDYQGVAAIAVVDDVRHVREAIRTSDCVVLAEVPDGP